MKAVTYSVCGTARDVLAVVELPDPRPGPGEVRVRLRYSGVNPTDWKRRTGENPRFGDYQIPHQDGSGVVDLVGAGVDSGRVGERVWVFHAATGRKEGTAAEWVCVPERQAVRLPDHIPLRVGATLGIPYLTAAHALASIAQGRAEHVLVTGGAGAVGFAATQLAVHLGARVVTTVSSEEKAALSRTAHPAAVLDYRSDGYDTRLAEEAADGFDLVVDVDLGTNATHYAPWLGMGARIVCYASGDAPVPIPGRALMFRNARIEFFVVYLLPGDAIASAVASVRSLLEAGHLTPLPIHEYSLEDVARAHDDVQGGLVGRALISLE